MDFQPAVLGRLPDGTEVARRVAGAVDYARMCAIAVIFVRVGFRPRHPEVNSANRIFATIAERNALKEGDPSAAIDPTVGVREDDIIVTKKRVSAFAGSDFETILRARGLRTLVLAGVSTSGVVLSTVREAADRDYQLVVLSDGCADQDAEVHEVLIRKVFPRQAEVMTIAEWSAGFGGETNS
jgi:nicotinamidase-related amidase